MRHRAVCGVTAYLPQTQSVKEIHLSGEISESCEEEEPAVRRPGNGVAVRGSELIQALRLAVEQRNVAGHVASCYYKSVRNSMQKKSLVRNS